MGVPSTVVEHRRRDDISRWLAGPGRTPSRAAFACCAAALLVSLAPSVLSARERGTRRDDPAPTRKATPSLSLAFERRLTDDDPASPMRLLVESGPITFEDAIEDLDFDRPGAVSVRVFSDRPWALRIVPESRFAAPDGGAQVPVSRLSWRTADRGGFTPFLGGEGATVARGPRTGGAGERVSVDLRLRLGQGDPLGRYQCALRLVLEPRYASGNPRRPGSHLVKPSRSAH